MSHKNYELLVEQAHNYVSESFLEASPSHKPPKKPDASDQKISDKPEFALTTFYTVAFSDDGETFETMNDKPTVHSNEELEALAKDIVYNRHREIGGEGKLIYYHIDKGTYNLVVFMDPTILIDHAAPLFHYTWMYSGIAFAVFFILSIFASYAISNPIEKASKTQKQFVSNASHELKTPISVINANTELLSRSIGKNQWLSNIQYESERMGVLVGHLLELSCSDIVPATMENVDFSRLVNGESLPFESVAYDKGLALTCNIAPNIFVHGNSSQLKQVVSVMLDNAIEHCDNKDPHIHLELKKVSCRCAKLRVTNSADKIPKEELEKIFQRFYRTNPATSTKDKHYGLGLAIAKNIVDNHKGKINVRCYNGKVEFQILIPLSRN